MAVQRAEISRQVIHRAFCQELSRAVGGGEDVGRVVKDNIADIIINRGVIIGHSRGDLWIQRVGHHKSIGIGVFWRGAVHRFPLISSHILQHHVEGDTIGNEIIVRNGFTKVDRPLLVRCIVGNRNTCSCKSRISSSGVTFTCINAEFGQSAFKAVVDLQFVQVRV